MDGRRSKEEIYTEASSGVGAPSQGRTCIGYERFTVSPGRCRESIPLEPRVLVVVPFEVDTDVGFGRARELLSEIGDGSIRLVGHGVTISSEWPAWVLHEPRLYLTEIGAYFDITQLAGQTRFARTQLLAWLRTVFAHVTPGLDAGEVFYVRAASRLFQPWLEMSALVQGIRHAHPDEKIHIAGDDAAILLSALLEQTVPGSETVSNARRRSCAGGVRRFSFLLSAAFAICACIVDQARWFVSAWASRRRLRELRRTRMFRKSPKIWLVLSPNWRRINLPLLRQIARPAQELGVETGVLLFGNLSCGERSESNLRKYVGVDLWPALDEICGGGAGLRHVDQVSMLETTYDFLAMLPKFVWNAAIAAFRIIRSNEVPADTGIGPALVAHSGSLALLTTQDVFRVMAAGIATRRFISRTPVKGNKVIFSASDSIADVLLRNAGATTIELFHGSGADWIGSSENFSSLRCVWSNADALGYSRFGRRTRVFSPIGRRRVLRPARRTENVLLLSNYMHRDTCVGGRFPHLPLAKEMLATIEGIRAAYPSRFSFRWRPHPADEVGCVKRLHATMDRLELSFGVPLAEDLAWADVVIASYSTAAIEALSSGIPVFHHLTPRYGNSFERHCYCDSRVFFWSSELIPRFMQCIAALDVRDGDALRPEQDAWERLFGENESHLSLKDLFEGSI